MTIAPETVMPPPALDPSTVMIKVLRPDALARCLRGELTAGLPLGGPPFDHRVVGGTVARQQDCAPLRAPADFVRTLGLGYPGSPFHPDLAVLHVLAFPVLAPGQFVPVPAAPDAVRTWWRRYAPVPNGATIIEHPAEGPPRPVAGFRGATLGWEDLR
jgi:hypothetical protein